MLPSRILIGLSLLTLPFALNGCLVAAGAGASAAGYSVAQERSVGTAVDDNGISLGINKKFLEEPDNQLFAHVDTHVTEGRVLLTGKVEKPEYAIRAVELAWQIEGVKEVVNEIAVTDKTGFVDYSRDAWITTQVKTRLLFTKFIKSVNYNVETVNQTVYLMGLAQDQAELDRVLQVARTTQYVQNVVSYVRLKTDPRRGRGLD